MASLTTSFELAAAAVWGFFLHLSLSSSVSNDRSLRSLQIGHVPGPDLKSIPRGRTRLWFCDSIEWYCVMESLPDDDLIPILTAIHVHTRFVSRVTATHKRRFECVSLELRSWQRDKLFKCEELKV
jgi:hypothetical protein